MSDTYNTLVKTYGWIQWLLIFAVIALIVIFFSLMAIWGLNRVMSKQTLTIKNIKDLDNYVSSTFKPTDTFIISRDDVATDAFNKLYDEKYKDIDNNKITEPSIDVGENIYNSIIDTNNNSSLFQTLSDNNTINDTDKKDDIMPTDNINIPDDIIPTDDINIPDDKINTSSGMISDVATVSSTEAVDKSIVSTSEQFTELYNNNNRFKKNVQMNKYKTANNATYERFVYDEDADENAAMLNKMGIEQFASYRVGGESFKIHEDLDNPEGAARMMSDLNKTAKTLISHINNKYTPTNLNIIKDEFKARVSRGINDLTNNYKTPNLEENIPERSGGDTSYVIDKGDTFAMCLRNPLKNNILETEYNDLTFVLIHEMCHLFTSTYGHDFMFWSNFKFLLQEAISINLYSPTDYKQTRSPYCGIQITYSPIHDQDLPEYKK